MEANDHLQIESYDILQHDCSLTHKRYFSNILLAKPRPQTDEFVRVYQIFCLRRRDAGYWMLDAGRRSRL